MSMTGKITSFSPSGEFYYIQPDDGSPRVLLYTKDLRVDSESLKPGTMVKFSYLQGRRGLTAYNAMILTADVSNSATSYGEQHKRTSTVCTRTIATGKPTTNVVIRSQYEDEITEALVSKIPTITAAQITEIRKNLTEYASRHGWL